MDPLRRAIAATSLLVTLLSPLVALAQVPPPVPALPDTERRTSFSLSSSTCACSVGFALYGDSTDYQDWVEVWINGARANYNDPAHGWTITSPTGPLATIARPVTDAVLTFTTAQTGTVQIVGARRPRRLSQFTEDRGVAARDLNQALTDIIAQNRETWDKINDVTGRAIVGEPGENLSVLAPATTRANTYLFFDSAGNPGIYSGNPPAMPVTNADMAPMPPNTVKCNPNGFSSQPSDCTTLSLNAMTLGSGGLTSSGNVSITGGSLTPVDLYTSPPANGIFDSAGGIAFGYCPVVGCIPGDTARAASIILATTSQTAARQEAAFAINMIVNTGLASQWSTSKPYSAGKQTETSGAGGSNNVYQETVSSCTTNASGTGPTGTGTGIADGSCVWNYVGPQINNGKEGMVDFVRVMPGAGSVWGNATDVVIDAGYAGTFVVNHELDITNNGPDAPEGITNQAYNLYLSGLIGTNPITAEIFIGPPPNGSFWGSHFGLLIGGGNSVKDVSILDLSNSAYAYEDQGAHTAGFNIQGTYTFAAFTTVNAVALSTAIAVGGGQQVCVNGLTECMKYNISLGYTTLPGGVTCSGAPTGSFATKGGIVTHC